MEDLFGSQSFAMRDELISYTKQYYKDQCWKSLSKDEFNECLEKSNHTFTNERYLREIKPGRSHGVSPMFLEAFSSALLLRLSRFRLVPRVF